MDIQQQNRPHLEPIQEESEQEDELEGSKTRESEDEGFQIQVGVETKTIMADDKSEEEEDDSALLRVLRPRRLSHSHSQDSIPQMQFTTNQQEKVENFSLSDWKSHTVGLSDEATPPKQARLRNNKRSTSEELRIKISKIRWQKFTPPKSPVAKRTKRKKKKPHVEPFPKWLVDLMVNIEEATSHQLVVE